MSHKGMDIVLLCRGFVLYEGGFVLKERKMKKRKKSAKELQKMVGGD